MKHNKTRKLVTNPQLTSSYESAQEQQAALLRIIGPEPTGMLGKILKAAWLETPLGPMLCIADDKALYLLIFGGRLKLEQHANQLRQKLKAAIIPGETAITTQLKKELNEYFDGKRTIFNTPIKLLGTDFQQQVWQTLMAIPVGETRSYRDIAVAVGNPKGYRAVARANATNRVVLLIPCHRVINANGNLGGYGCGLNRKEWLLNHEGARAFSP